MYINKKVENTYQNPPSVSQSETPTTPHKRLNYNQNIFMRSDTPSPRKSKTGTHRISKL